jgi:hypothetical protein
VARNEERIDHMIGEADEMMQLAKQALNASNDLLGDPKLRAEIKQTVALTRPLGERGPAIVEAFDTSMKKLNKLSDNMLRFSQDLNDPQGSLGAVLHDKELYQHVNHIAKNIDELSRDLKPIVDNVWTFTDKIARHPGDLGVRGALKKDSGLKDSSLRDGDATTDPEDGRWPIGGSGRWSIGR